MAAPTRPRAFTVRGRGAFPVDMLRYDSCWPASEADAGEVERSYQPRSRQAREVMVLTASNAAPTTERWRSFGWGVIDQ